MIVSLLTKEAIDFVIDNIDPVCKKEANEFGKTLDTLRKEFYEMQGEPWSSAFYDQEGLCKAICFLEPLGTMQFRTHFAFAKGFEDIGYSITKFLGKMTDSMVRHENAYIEILSPLNDRKAFEWFEAMGFEHHSEMDGVHRYVKMPG